MGCLDFVTLPAPSSPHPTRICPTAAAIIGDPHGINSSLVPSLSPIPPSTSPVVRSPVLVPVGNGHSTDHHPSTSPSPAPSSTLTRVSVEVESTSILLEFAASQADLLLHRIDQWLNAFHVKSLLATQLEQAERLLRPSTPARGQTFLRHLERISSTMIALENAYVASADFYAHFQSLVLHIPKDRLLEVTSTIKDTVDTRSKILVGLTSLLNSVRSWLSEPSPNLSGTLNLVVLPATLLSPLSAHFLLQLIDMTTNDYKHGFLTSAQVAKLKSGAWLSDDVLNYGLGRIFSIEFPGAPSDYRRCPGNPYCSDAILRGDHEDILVCSVMLMPRIQQLKASDVDSKTERNLFGLKTVSPSLIIP